MRHVSRGFGVAAIALLPLGLTPAQAQLRGHGGPVRAVAVSPDGTKAVSGSFDTSAIRWSLTRSAAEQVLRFHDGAVNSVVFLADGRVATAGKEGRIALWRAGEQKPSTVLNGHTNPILALAVSPDGAHLASASWDRTVRVWPLGGGEARVFKGHQDNANGVAFAPDGRTLVSVGYDAAVRLWSLERNGGVGVRTLPTPLNTVAVAPDGEIVAAGSDGKVYFLSATGQRRGEIAAQETPVIAVAVSRDGKLIAAAGIRGSVAIIDRASRTITRTLIGPGKPRRYSAAIPTTERPSYASRSACALSSITESEMSIGT
jgi:cytochrome c